MGAGDAGERDVDDRHAVAALRRLHHRSAGLPRRRSGQGRQPLQQSARRHPGQDQTPRYAESDRVCPILLSNTVFYWVLLGFAGFLLRFTWFFYVILAKTRPARYAELDRVLSEFDSIAPGFTGFYRVFSGFGSLSLDFTRFC